MNPSDLEILLREARQTEQRLEGELQAARDSNGGLASMVIAQETMIEQLQTQLQAIQTSLDQERNREDKSGTIIAEISTNVGTMLTAMRADKKDDKVENAALARIEQALAALQAKPPEKKNGTDKITFDIRRDQLGVPMQIIASR